MRPALLEVQGRDSRTEDERQCEKIFIGGGRNLPVKREGSPAPPGLRPFYRWLLCLTEGDLRGCFLAIVEGCNQAA